MPGRFSTWLTLCACSVALWSAACDRAAADEPTDPPTAELTTIQTEPEAPTTPAYRPFIAEPETPAPLPTRRSPDPAPAMDAPVMDRALLDLLAEEIAREERKEEAAAAAPSDAEEPATTAEAPAAPAAPALPPSWQDVPPQQRVEQLERRPAQVEIGLSAGYNEELPTTNPPVYGLPQGVPGLADRVPTTSTTQQNAPSSSSPGVRTPGGAGAVSYPGVTQTNGLPTTSMESVSINP